MLPARKVLVCRYWIRFFALSVLFLSLSTLAVVALFLVLKAFLGHAVARLLATVTGTLAFMGALAAGLTIALRVRGQAIRLRSPLQFSDFLSSPVFPSPPHAAVAEAFLRVVAGNLAVPADRIYPEDSFADLYYPLTFTDLVPLIGPDSVMLIMTLAGIHSRLPIEAVDGICRDIAQRETIAECLMCLERHLSPLLST